MGCPWDTTTSRLCEGLPTPHGFRPKVSRPVRMMETVRSNQAARTGEPCSSCRTVTPRNDGASRRGWNFKIRGLPDCMMLRPDRNYALFTVLTKNELTPFLDLCPVRLIRESLDADVGFRVQSRPRPFPREYYEAFRVRPVFFGFGTLLGRFSRTHLRKHSAIASSV